MSAAGSALPHINAVLNAASALLLIAGYIFIRNRKIGLHKLCMGGAFAASTLFLVSYLYYHYNVGSVKFQGQGWIRGVYFSILISHTILAVGVLPLVLRTFWLALNSRFEAHHRIARWTLPVWLYVSLTGVLVYIFLYKGVAS
ncbi:MAG: DUF420 domain-containing protein [Elusimicrobia bacterium]|nr:DUF420 domain-containing protein [Elusimicrobiota bacterium]